MKRRDVLKALLGIGVYASAPVALSSVVSSVVEREVVPTVPLPNDGHWHQIVVTRNDGWLRLFIDGDEVDAIEHRGNVPSITVKDNITVTFPIVTESENFTVSFSVQDNSVETSLSDFKQFSNCLAGIQHE